MSNYNSGPTTSPSLLLRIRNPDDMTSWETFERIYGIVVRSYCRHWKIHLNDADDIVQEVMIDVAKGIRNFDYDPGKGRFQAWLGTVTANKIKQFHRRTSKRQETSLPASDDLQVHQEFYTDPDSRWVDIFTEQVLSEACRNVRPEFEEVTWNCFEATWVDHKPPTNVAQELGIAVHSVYVNKSRVLKRLEAEVRNLAEDLACDFT